MGKQINVASFEDMEKAANNLQEHSDTYRKIYNELLQNASTMGTAWEGADNLAFVKQITGFAEKLDYMAKKLSLASQTLKQQKDNYVNRQEDNITQVSKLVN